LGGATDARADAALAYRGGRRKEPLAEQQGGRIDSASAGPGRGATFSVWFVRAGDRAAAAAADEPQVPAVLCEAPQQRETDVS
jgi:hypothetical protein